MVNLSVERMNEKYPYNLMPSKRPGYFTFTTDFEVKYTVGFELTEGVLSFPVYLFLIINANNKKSPRDRKLRETIMIVLYEFFDANNSVMLYICDTGDNRQALRHRLFQYWYLDSMRHDDFSMFSAHIVDDEGNDNYTALFLRIDNPDFEEVAAEFHRTVRLFNQKP